MKLNLPYYTESLVFRFWSDVVGYARGLWKRRGGVMPGRAGARRERRSLPSQQRLLISVAACSAGPPACSLRHAAADSFASLRCCCEWRRVLRSVRVEAARGVSSTFLNHRLINCLSRSADRVFPRAPANWRHASTCATRTTHYVCVMLYIWMYFGDWRIFFRVSKIIKSCFASTSLK